MLNRITKSASLFVCGMLLIVGCGCERPAERVPVVVDEAAVLSPEATLRIESLAESMLLHQRVQLQVYIPAQSPPDMDALALQLVEDQQLGKLAGGARGLLLLVDPQREQVRLEIGYDLEGVFSDVIAARIEHDQMAPFFAANRVGDGIEASLELLVAEHPEQDDTSSAVGERYSGGAGAKAAVGFHQELAPEFSGPMSQAVRSRFVPQPTPLAALELYREILQEHVKDPELTLYTPSTREFFASWLVTDVQQNNELRDLVKNLPSARVFEQGPLAVVRFDVAQRENAPYLFERCDAGWQLDFSTMSRIIGFNRRNQWFFRTLNHPFMFAFADWSFDGNGFPYSR